MPKLSLVKAAASAGSYSIRGGVLSIGAYIIPGTNKTILFDTGLETSQAKNLVKLLRNTGLTEGPARLELVGIINTHGHADHCGGNQYLQSVFPDVQTYATSAEAAFIKDPALEPNCFCGGAAPLAELQNKFLQAPPSSVTHELETGVDISVEIESATFQIIALPGHTRGMIGIITPDRVFYSGDALFGPGTFDKHGVLFYTDIQATLNSFNKLLELSSSFRGVVLYHGGEISADTLPELIVSHRQKILLTAQTVLDLAGSVPGASIEDLTAATMEVLKVPANPVQFALTRTCVSAYVSYLQATNNLKIEMDRCKMVVRRVSPKAILESSREAAGDMPEKPKPAGILFFQESQDHTSVKTTFGNYSTSEVEDLPQRVLVSLSCVEGKYLYGDVHSDREILMELDKLCRFAKEHANLSLIPCEHSDFNSSIQSQVGVNINPETNSVGFLVDRIHLDSLLRCFDALGLKQSDSGEAALPADRVSGAEAKFATR